MVQKILGSRTCRWRLVSVPRVVEKASWAPTRINLRVNFGGPTSIQAGLTENDFDKPPLNPPPPLGFRHVPFLHAHRSFLRPSPVLLRTLPVRFRRSPQSLPPLFLDVRGLGEVVRDCEAGFRKAASPTWRRGSGSARSKKRRRTQRRRRRGRCRAQR